MKEGYRTNKNGWNYIQLNGTSSQCGYWHGRLLAKEITSAIQEAKGLILLQTGLDWNFFAKDNDSIIHHWKEVLKTDPYGQFYEEMEAVVSGVNAEIGESALTVTDLLLWNGYTELTEYWYPSVADELYRKLPGPDPGNRQAGNDRFRGAHDHCSAFIATGSYTEDGRIVLAHNSFTTFENSNYSNTIISIKPKEGYPMIMQATAGYIHSLSDFYLTSTGEKQGLMISETTIGGFHAYDPDGVPEFVRIRYAVQYSRTLDEFAERFWHRNNGGYANTWLAGDIGTNEIMRFEAGLKFCQIDKTKDGYFAGFNAPEDPRIRNLECTNTGFADIRRHQGARQVRIPQLMEAYKGRLNVSAAQKIMADHYDVYLDKENPSSRTICSHYDLDDRQFMSQAGRPVPYQPQGAVDGITASAAGAEALTLWARWGSSCGTPFYAEDFLKKHPQFQYLSPYLKDRPAQPWTKFKAGEDNIM